MRLVARILGVLGALCVPAVVMLFGCEVDETRPPGLQDEVPNNKGTPYVALPPSSASSTTSGSSSSGGVMAAQSICDVASSLELNPVQACQSCASTAISDPTQCQAQSQACNLDQACLPGVAQCMTGTCASASAPANCVETCISQDQNFVVLMTCLFNICGAQCGQPTPVLCDSVDAGSPDSGALDGGGNG